MAKKRTRKSRSQIREEKKQQKIRFWMGIFVISIMVFSVFSFAFVFYGMGGVQGADGLQYRVTEDNRLLVQTTGGEIPFYSFPDSQAPIPARAKELLQGAQAIIVVFDPLDEENLVYLDLVRWEFSEYLPVPVGAAIVNESEEYPYDIGGCELATEQTPVVAFENGQQGVFVEDACIIVSASGESIILQRDQLLYAYYDIR